MLAELIRLPVDRLQALTVHIPADHSDTHIGENHTQQKASGFITLLSRCRQIIK